MEEGIFFHERRSISAPLIMKGYTLPTELPHLVVVVVLGFYVPPIARSYGDDPSVLVSSKRVEKLGIELMTLCLQGNSLTTTSSRLLPHPVMK